MRPLVSIGIPVKIGFSINDEKKIDLLKSLDPILNQTYNNLEIIISNNFSDNKTRDYLKKVAENDKRIRLFDQKNELSWAENFKFVLDNSTGDYFKWNAADDIISTDFVEKNINFLENNKDFVSSSSKFYYEDKPNNVNFFNLEDKLYLRIKNFFKYRHISHNILYSLIRKEILKETIDISKDYWAVDWIFNLDLLLNGKFKTLDQGYVIYGTKGISRKKDFIDRKVYSNKNIYRILPYYELMKNLFLKTLFLKNLSIFEKISIYFTSVKINYHFFKQKFKKKHRNS
tara:strand:- start:224 stop:1084 length:861 start_codon:yes stop_codon:yes gene_type:complete